MKGIIENLCPPLQPLCSAVCRPFPGLLHGPPPGFVWPSTWHQQDLMTFIIRWGDLIWAAPLSEMSSSIRRHAGENKRMSNYSLGLRVGWVRLVGDEGTQRERRAGKRDAERGLWKKSIASCRRQVMRFELGSVSSLWPEQWSALLSASPLDGRANKRGEPGRAWGAVCRDTRVRPD